MGDASEMAEDGRGNPTRCLVCGYGMPGPLFCTPCYTAHSDLFSPYWDEWYAGARDFPRPPAVAALLGDSGRQAGDVRAERLTCVEVGQRWVPKDESVRHHVLTVTDVFDGRARLSCAAKDCPIPTPTYRFDEFGDTITLLDAPGPQPPTPPASGDLFTVPPEFRYGSTFTQPGRWHIGIDPGYEPTAVAIVPAAPTVTRREAPPRREVSNEGRVWVPYESVSRVAGGFEAWPWRKVGGEVVARPAENAWRPDWGVGISECQWRDQRAPGSANTIKCTRPPANPSTNLCEEHIATAMVAKGEVKSEGSPLASKTVPPEAPKGMP